MKKFLHPYWIFACITIPQILLMGLYAHAYQIIGSLLSPENIAFWIGFGTSLTALCSIATGYAIYLLARDKSVAAPVGVFGVLAYMVFLFFFGWYQQNIIPWNIPRWMLFKGDLTLWAFTFIMPALAYSGWLILLWLSPKGGKHKILPNFLATLAIPVSWYVAFVVIDSMTLHLDFAFMEELAVIIFLLSTFSFLFFLVRGIFIWMQRKDSFTANTKLLWTALLGIVFPIAGLVVNTSIFGTAGDNEGFFGNFDHPLFYGIALVNGLLLCLPASKYPKFSLPLFFAKSVGFTYVAYFFIVFLPYLPLSIIGILAIGTGFLMLTPLILTGLQGQLLIDDFTYLKENYNGRFLTGVFLSGVLVLPALLVTSYSLDRHHLHKALDYVYTPNYAEPNPSIKTASIERILHQVAGNKSRRGRSNDQPFMTNRQPYLSSFYSSMVLDNQTLSDDKIQLLEKIFLGKREIANTNISQMPSSAEVEIDSIRTESTYHAAENYWTTWVHLDIKNQSIRQREFVTELELPDGCWISDYYLDVFGKRKKGLLSEKKSAMWVYRQIVSVTRRDPGILFYEKNSTVNFRVFPFAANETRQTGIEFIHQEPMDLTIDNQVVTLGDPTKMTPPATVTYALDKQVAYIPASVKADLQKVKRQPYFHFIVEASVNAVHQADENINSVEKVLQSGLLSPQNAKFTFAGFDTKDFLKEDLKQANPNDMTFKGGFFAERAMQQALFEHHLSGKGGYPVFVLIADEIDKAIFTGQLADMEFAFPESSLFYFYNKETKQLSSHSMIGNPYAAVEKLVSEIPQKEVLVYMDAGAKTTWLADDGQGTMILENGTIDVTTLETKGKTFENALALDAMWQTMQLYPELEDKHWKKLVKNSFASQVMTPLTSYIVLENEAQEAALKAKQAEMMNADLSVDAGEELKNMSEPPLWLMVLIAGLGLLFFRRKKMKGFVF